MRSILSLHLCGGTYNLIDHAIQIESTTEIPASKQTETRSEMEQKVSNQQTIASKGETQKMMLTYVDVGMHKDAREMEIMLHLCDELGINMIAYGYEAHPAYCQRLQHLYRNHHNINIINAAVCDQEGVVPLFLSPASNGEGNSIYASKNNVISRSIDVPAVRMSDELQRIEIGDFVILRCNIEGAELQMMSDLITTGMHKHIDVWCGALSDIPKVAEIRDEMQRYQQMLDDAGIYFQRFHATYLRNDQDAMIEWMRQLLINTSSIHTAHQGDS
jgi:FkbM family methyltransferase